MFLNPFTALPFGSSAASSISVDQGTHLYNLIKAGLALQNPQTGTVPIANANYLTAAGDSILWDHTKALELFNALKNNQAVPGEPAQRHPGRRGRLQTGSARSGTG